MEIILDLKSIKVFGNKPREKRRICHLAFNFNAVNLIFFDNEMEYEIQEDAIENPDEKDMEQTYEEACNKDKYPTILPINLKIRLNTSTWNKLPKILVLVKSRCNYR